uniref:Uncharacterized protein n=1 Tax=Tanacetum cinerariifolium TaxID=118510 RepID=A0A6L2KNW5_TANCI|nr:hypothetical protein [Tanacetum cinerariifolium]
MAEPIIPISVEENLRDPINIKVDIIHPKPVAAVSFPKVTVVMAAPIIPIFAEENLRDPIDIRVDIIHPELVVAVSFPEAAVEELTALRFRVDISKAENVLLHASIKTTEAIEKITHSQERKARMEMA